MKVFILLALLLTGCGTKPFEELKDVLLEPDPPKSEPRPQSHADFQHYKAQYTYYSGRDISDIPITYSDDLSRYGERVTGVCHQYSSGGGWIELVKSDWEGYDDYQRQILIFHELGHCDMRLNHADTMDGNCPVSIMRSWLFNTYEVDYCYIPRFSAYLDELFE